MDKHTVQSVLAHPAIRLLVEAFNPVKITVRLITGCLHCGNPTKGKDFCSELCENDAMLWRRAIEKND